MNEDQLRAIEKSALDILYMHSPNCALLEYVQARNVLELFGEINRLNDNIAEWVEVGDRIMVSATGKTGPLSDSDVIGEFDRLRYCLRIARTALIASNVAYSDVGLARCRHCRKPLGEDHTTNCIVGQSLTIIDTYPIEPLKEAQL